jgi:hypothetical protein
MCSMCSYQKALRYVERLQKQDPPAIASRPLQRFALGFHFCHVDDVFFRPCIQTNNHFNSRLRPITRLATEMVLTHSKPMYIAPAAVVLLPSHLPRLPNHDWKVSHDPWSKSTSAADSSGLREFQCTAPKKCVLLSTSKGNSKMICQSQHALIRYDNPASRKGGPAASRL